jgi:iron(III) transport system ATP-binding protein
MTLRRYRTNTLTPGPALHVGPATGAILLALALVSSCRSGNDPVMPVSDFRVWQIPTEGAAQPAPRSVAVGPGDEVYVLDTVGRVLVYTAEGQLARQWRMPDAKVGRPEGLCILTNGEVVVCDTHYHQVVVFDQTGAVRRAFGRQGTGPGEFIYPVAVTVDSTGDLYVAEYGSNDRIQKFHPDGTHILTFGGFGAKSGEFQRPSGIVWRDDKIYAVDAFNNRLQVFSDTGRFLQVLDGPPPLDLRLPYDLKLGPDGTLYVVEYGAGRVSRISVDGRLLGRYGSTGTGHGQFVTPWGLAVDSRGRIRVADTGNRRLVELLP